tara:strand:- start:180 stop:317 length:138 start_codon:yes stop_codon:yes gene_type:complete
MLHEERAREKKLAILPQIHHRIFVILCRILLVGGEKKRVNGAKYI